MKSSTSQRAGISRSFLPTMYLTIGATVRTRRSRIRPSPVRLYSCHSSSVSCADIRPLLSFAFRIKGPPYSRGKLGGRAQVPACVNDIGQSASVYIRAGPQPRSVVTRNVARKRSQILLLRGINLGPNRRVAMPELRQLLTDAGFEDVRTYVASGNVVLTSSLSADKLGAKSEKLIAERFGFDVDVIVRTADELAEVVRSNPLADVAEDPK